MKISANRFARWLVQGERSSVSSDDTGLIFTKNDQIETFPFANWDGRCQIERGLIWGKMTFEISSLSGEKEKITVFGLPWRKINRSANELTVEYQNWLQSQREYLAKSQSKLIDLQKELDDHNGYLRHSDLALWEQKANKKLKSLAMHPQTISILSPSLYQSFYGWLIDPEKRRNERNEWWLRRELQHWQSWFRTVDKSPFNDSQQNAVLIGEDNTLVLAGAGSGKTSVLVARARYLIESKQCSEDQVVMLAFGKKASEEIKQRLITSGLKDVQVATFHSFAMKVIKETFDEQPVISLLATDEKAKKEWMVNWLEETFNNSASHKRWLTHIEQWPIAGLNAKKPLIEQVNKLALHKWLWRHLDLLLQHPLPPTAMRKELLDDAQALSELTLLMPLCKQYSDYLTANNEYDFHGLIERATDGASRKNNNMIKNISHVLVDEFQDISPNRVAFLEALCKPNRQHAPALFAVGDDWQAIYRFAGSDLSLTTDFAKRFPSSNVLHLDTTYRFNDKIGEVANPFVQVNPKQLLKELRSHQSQDKKAVHTIPDTEIEKVLADLAKLTSKQKISLLLIGRNNNNKPKKLGSWQTKWPKIKMQYVTAHASKGLEADYCIILDVNEGVFPALSKEAGLEYMLLTDFDEIEHAEERRLFYVAITRARHACWVSCDPLTPSMFVEELVRGYPVNNSIKELMKSKKKKEKRKGSDIY